jgi:hypothetical protein
VRRRVRPAFPALPAERHEHLVFAIGVSDRHGDALSNAPLAFACYLHWRTDFAELIQYGRLNRSETVDLTAVIAGARQVRFVERGREVPCPPGLLPTPPRQAP